MLDTSISEVLSGFEDVQRYSNMSPVRSTALNSTCTPDFQIPDSEIGHLLQLIPAKAYPFVLLGSFLDELYAFGLALPPVQHLDGAGDTSSPGFFPSTLQVCLDYLVEIFTKRHPDYIIMHTSA